MSRVAPCPHCSRLTVKIFTVRELLNVVSTIPGQRVDDSLRAVDPGSLAWWCPLCRHGGLLLSAVSQ